MTVKLIAHALIQKENKYLLIQRTAIKRGQKNIYPHFWDIPGGSVEAGETPQEAARREDPRRSRLRDYFGSDYP